MSWSYNPEQLSTEAKYRVRMRLGDVFENAPLLQDEEIEFQLSNTANEMVATIRCCEMIVARLAPAVYSKLGPAEYNDAQKHAHFVLLLKLLKDEYVSLSAPYYETPKKTIFDLDMMSVICFSEVDE